MTRWAGVCFTVQKFCFLQEVVVNQRENKNTDQSLQSIIYVYPPSIYHLFSIHLPTCIYHISMYLYLYLRIICRASLPTNPSVTIHVEYLSPIYPTIQYPPLFPVIYWPLNSM